MFMLATNVIQIEHHAFKALFEGAKRASSCSMKDAGTVNLPIDCLVCAYVVMIAPILLYGPEIWGFGYSELIDRVHLKFLNLASGLQSSTSNFMA